MKRAQSARLWRLRTVNAVLLIATVLFIVEQFARGGPAALLLVAAVAFALLGVEHSMLRARGVAWRHGWIIAVGIDAAAIAVVAISGPLAAPWIMVAIIMTFAQLRAPASTGIAGAVVVVTTAIVWSHDPTDVETATRVLLAGTVLTALAHITARSVRRVENDLVDMTQLLNDTVGTISQGIAIYAPDGRVRFLNQRAVELLDLPVELLCTELTVQDILDLQWRRGELSPLFERMPAGSHHTTQDWRVVLDSAPTRYSRRMRDGRWVEVQTFHMPSGDTVRTYADVTSYEEARARAEVAAEAKVRFLSNMSHELRTPMIAILGLTERTLTSDLSEQQHAWLRRIDDAGRELLSLVDGILEVSAPRAEAAVIESAEFGVREVLFRATAEAAAACAEKGVEFRLDISSEVPESVVGDGRSVEQVLRHLATNAVRFTAQGRIEIRVRAERAASEARLTVAVQDTGLGFDADERERLFSAFEQPDATAAQAYGGSALGLALAKRLVDRMHGDLGVQSKRGVGSTFWFSAQFGEVSSEATPVAEPIAAASRATPPFTAPVPAAPSSDASRPTAAPIVAPPPSTEAPDPGTAPITEVTAEFQTPAAMSEVQGRVFVLMQQLSQARRRLATIPQRTYFLTATFGALTTFVVLIAYLARLALSPDAPFVPGLIVVPTLLGAMLGVIAWRQRKPATPRTSREMLVSAAVVLTVYIISMFTNGHPPVLMLAAWIAALYITQRLAAARIMSALASLSAIWTLISIGGPFELMVRSLAGGLLVWALMEMLMPVLGEAINAFGAAAKSLQTVSNELVLENQRLSVATTIAEDAARTKSEVVASVSHEIRTPVNAILGLSQVMLQGELAPRQRERLQKIEDSGRHLLALVNHVLDLSKLEAGKFRLELGPVRLKAVLAHVLDAARPEGDARELEISSVVDPTVPDVVVGDRLRLTQVLLNFVANAAKYTPRGSIVVRVQRVSETAEGMQLRFEVEDTGVGLTAEQRERLFQPFEQVQDAMRQEKGGAGLGLSISKWLVEQMGGMVGVESRPGVGSTFWFTALLGLTQEGADAITSAERSRLDLLARRGARVLVVDDNAINREVASALLREGGISVEEADGGEAAIASAMRETFDLILMDLHMHGMDGFAATQRLRADQRTRQVPIIALTANALPEIRQRCLSIGMNDYLSKPFTQRDLAEAVVRWVPARVRQNAVPAATVSSGDASVTAIHAAVEVEIPAAHGLDTADGLARFLDDRQLYREMLTRFVEEYGGFADEVDALLRTGDLEAAHRRAHTLKSVAAMLGASGLAEAAKLLESLVRTDAMDPAAPEALADLRVQLSPLVDDLRRALGDGTTSGEFALAAQ